MRLSEKDFVGEVTVVGDTTYYIELVSLDGESYRGSNKYDISVLEDQPPVISFDRPGRDKKARISRRSSHRPELNDYGVVSMDLHFAVNGGEEKRVNLQQLSRESARSLAPPSFLKNTISSPATSSLITPRRAMRLTKQRATSTS